MENWIIKQKIDFARPVSHQGAPDVLMLPGDNLAHTWQVACLKNDIPVDLSGASVTAYFLRTDGNAVMVTGEASGNIASVTLAQECYAFAGGLRGVMRITDSETEAVVSMAEHAFVVRPAVDAGGIIDPGEVIPSIDELIAMIGEMEDVTAAAEAAATKSVRYDSAQTLTDAQKEQARGNIDAASEDDVDDLKSAFDEFTTTEKSYELAESESVIIPTGTVSQSVTFDITPGPSNDKIITNKVASGNLPYTPQTNGVKYFTVDSGFIDTLSGSNCYILFHIKDLTTDAFSIMGAGAEYIYTEQGVNTGGKKITLDGWYYVKTSNGFSAGYYNKNKYTIDYMVAVDSAELATRYPDITWDIDTFIENFPVAKYGELAPGETYTPAGAQGKINITHDGTTTSYTGMTVTATVYAGDEITAIQGSVEFELHEPIVYVRTVNGITPDSSGNVEISPPGISQIALMLCKNNNLNYKGEATDSIIAGLTPSLNDAYIYRTSQVQGLYSGIVCDGDILYYDGTDWQTLRFDPATYDLYPNDRSYDVVIVGGGAGGIGAAYALKDSGYKVCVVEALDSLGGTHVNGGVIQMLSSPAPGFLKTILEDMETNLPNVVSESSQKSYGDSSESAFDKHWRGGLITPSSGRGTTYSINPWAFSDRYYKDLTDAGIDVLCGVEFQSLEQDNGVVRNITVKHRHSGLVEKIWGFYFVDSTSFGSLCTYDKTLGTDYYRGTDDRARFNESAIPQDYTADPTKVNTSEADYMFEDTTENYNAPLCKNTNAFAASQGQWKVPNGIGKTIKVMSTEGSDRSSAYIFTDYPRSVNESKNRTKDHFRKYFGETSAHRYIQSMPLIAMRETNRIKCGAAFTENNLTTTATTQNYRANHYVALASWHVDLHNNTGVDTEALPTPSRLCGLPYEALIPDAYDNVLVGSKCFGSSHIGLSYFRLTKTCMSIGYAAGKAVKLAIADGFLDDLRDVDIEDLQDEIGIGAMLADIETYYDLNNI